MAVLRAEKTYELQVALEDNAGSLLMFLTISGLQPEVTNVQTSVENHDISTNYVRTKFTVRSATSCSCIQFITIVLPGVI